MKKNNELEPVNTRWSCRSVDRKQDITIFNSYNVVNRNYDQRNTLPKKYIGIERSTVVSYNRYVYSTIRVPEILLPTKFYKLLSLYLKAIHHGTYQTYQLSNIRSSTLLENCEEIFLGVVGNCHQQINIQMLPYYGVFFT